MTKPPITTHLARLAAGTLLASALVIPAGTALAQSTPGPSADAANPATGASLSTARTRCLRAIDRRLTDLGRLQQTVDGAAALTGEHRTALTAIRTDATAVLTALQPSVEAAADRATLRTLCQQVTRDVRVYALRVPQARLTIDLDRESGNVARLDAVAVELQAAIDAKQQQGKDTAKAQTALATMQSHLASARGRLAGKADALLLVTPADWNANNAILNPYRTDVRTTRTDLRQATRAATKVRLELRKLA